MIPPKHRLDAKLTVTPGCWHWTGATHTDGYGRIYINGKGLLAHRVAFVHYRGEIPEGLHVRHKCDNPRCVNPDHLELGTHQDNMRDKVLRKRCRTSDRRGEKNTQVKVTAESVLKIRADQRTLKAIASEYGLSESAVSLIRNRKNWKHL